MAHKALMGGTVYEKKGGADLVGGTVYKKDNGKVLVGGTAYEVGFGPAMATVTINVTLGGYGDSLTGCYVSIDGVQYTTDTTIEVPVGTEIYCYVSGGSTSVDVDLDITLNGTSVASAETVIGPAKFCRDYYYTVNRDVSINFSYKKTSWEWYCYIAIAEE